MNFTPPTRRPALCSPGMLGIGLLLATAAHALNAAAPPAPAPDAALLRAHDACAAGQLSAGRAQYARLAADTNAPAALRSIAQLSLAQSWQRQKDWNVAEKAYTALLAIPGTPAHHLEEARNRLQEISRLRSGQPAHKPAASHRAPPRRAAPGAQWHVSADGADTHPGTPDRPFATLERARDEIRRLKQRGALPAGAVAVVVHGGHYAVARPFVLTAEDSGTADAPIVYRAAAGEIPVFRGGARLTGFTPVRDAEILRRLPEEARGRVWQADLKAQGITSVPPVRVGGFASGATFQSHPAFELFFDGEAMPLARWPNEGFVNVVEVRGPTRQTGHGPAGCKEGILTYAGDRPARWAEDRDILLYGYWFYGWADSYERVEAIDPGKRQITLARPFHTYGYRAGQPYVAMNLLSEIDQPGEWYLDRQHLLLYFYPPSPPSGALIEASLASHPLVELKEVSHVTFERLTWELGGTDGLRASGGAYCLLAGCTVRRLGGNGLEFNGGTDHGVLSCDFESLGRGGVVMTGGNRKTLAPGRHFVENCHIRDLSRLDRTYTPAVLLNGVGNRIAHNLFHDIRSSALRVEGNEHLVEFNEIARVVLESDDQGGVDMFGNPTYRGNVYRFNYFHHVGSWQHPRQAPDCGQAGIRLDDMISGTLIYGNLFRRCAAGRLGFGGVQIHGGKDNWIDHNLFVDCATAVSFSPWGEATWRERTAGALDAPAIDRTQYLERYPDLARLNEHPNVNHLWRNLVVRCGEFLRRNRGGARLLGNVVLTNTPALQASVPGSFSFEDAAALLDRPGFHPLPFDEIGLYRDAYRPTLPAARIATLRNP
ncbi:MAG: right-handed parallel beta-helix repeat-containing protein [Verrucomicrobia bacterium]|nr:right-handed parallel beta-helix repeat-containing protein [Verrucomicrobiota bacterium]